MTVFLILLTVLGSIAAYLGIGIGAAWYDRPAAWERAKRYGSSARMARNSVVEQAFFMVALWPVVGPLRVGQWFARRHLADRLVGEDPAVERLMLQNRINELEHELGFRRER